MALAMIYPEPDKGGRGKNVESRKAAETAAFSSSLNPMATASTDDPTQALVRALKGLTNANRDLNVLATTAHELADRAFEAALARRVEETDAAVAAFVHAVRRFRSEQRALRQSVAESELFGGPS
jgi:hypothetical protein